MYVTKSDIAAVRECDTKLFYRKHNYPSLLSDDPYLDFLADGGYMVEEMARLLHPDGRQIGGLSNAETSSMETRRELAGGDCTLFEATFIDGLFLARVDILRRSGAELHLIEVKSSSINSADDNPAFRGKRGKIESSWRSTLEDVTFQVMVLSRVYPQLRVIPYLCVVDKARVATENSTFDKFRLADAGGAQGKYRPEVTYLGDPSKLSEEHVLAIIPVADEVAELMDEVEARAKRLAGSIAEGEVRKISTPVGLKCKTCEFRTKSGSSQVSGFDECWEKLSKVEPHILDLYRIDLIGGRKSDFVQNMAAAGQARLTDVPDNMLRGKSSDRQRVQIEYTKRDEEYIEASLPGILANHSYPLHFIDFEASRLALPYHAGMRPYEIAAFQWSCHTLRDNEGGLSHQEWLNDIDAFPNFEFARSLRNAVGDAGTIYVWSPYERTTLTSILNQMEVYGEEDHDLAEWLAAVSDPGCPRVVDLCELAKQHYFHPIMKGRLSIKYVLPAVWIENASLRNDPLFAEYQAHDADGNLMNPYDTLPPLPIGDSEEVVKEGTGAMRVYQEMMYGVSGQNPDARQSCRDLLLQYCRLDTLAMVMIWKHWADCFTNV